MNYEKKTFLEFLFITPCLYFFKNFDHYKYRRWDCNWCNNYNKI